MIEGSKSSLETLAEEVGLLVMRWQEATEAFDEEVGRRFGLNAAERHALSVLWRGPLTASALAAEIHLTPAAVTALIDRLERRDYLRRGADAADRRKVLVSLGPAAQALTAAVYAPLGEAGGRMLAGFTAAELDSFAKVLRQTIALQRAARAALVETGEVPANLSPAGPGSRP